MDEEFVEHDLEERMYAAFHYVDETQSESTNYNHTPNFDNLQQSTLRRYWRTSEKNTTYNKVSTPSNKINTSTNKLSTKDTNRKETDKSQNKSKDERPNQGVLRTELSILQQTAPSNVKKTIEILETEDRNSVVELETSDEDEVVEVLLPPKPTITIESSDEDICISTKSVEVEKKALVKPNNERDVTSSPVPSIVSSVSDEFIRSDCIALNISSKQPDTQSFDFSYHGSDRVQTPSKKKKKKRSTTTSTPISLSKTNDVDEYFATPTSNARNKKHKRKSYQVLNISVPSADVYDSDSNQSIADISKASYKVTDKSLPNTDVYETDSNQSENVKDNSPTKTSDVVVGDADSSEQQSEGENPPNYTENERSPLERRRSLVELTDMDTTIEENIVMANVTGLSDNEDSIIEIDSPNNNSKCGSTKIPAILYEDLDFDNLKGNKVCKRRRYSLTALRAEMEKFYNESWGGEDFNHREIQKNMSRDKSLWVIDPKDRMPVLAKRKVTCNYCNRVGHRDDACKMKTPICYMCGSTGHYEPRCPKKICVNCGSPNHVYTTMCRNCSHWNSIKCAECGQYGHPSSHCPDLWRRYHNTISLDIPLDENRQMKKHYQMHCSGCARRGHLIHTCRISLPFSGLPIYSPYVTIYRPVYCPTMNENYSQNTEPNNSKVKPQKKNTQDAPNGTPKNDSNKRQSKSPVAIEFLNKRRNLGISDDPKCNLNNSPQRKRTQSKDICADNEDTNRALEKKDTQSDNTPDCISISSSNHDKKGQMIQDNEVSDTSEVITSARIYITNEVCDLLKTKDAEDWLKQSTTKNNIVVENTDMNFFLSIKGSVGSQEAFQSELRDYIKSKQPNKEHRISESDANESIEVNDEFVSSDNIPKNRNNVLRKLGKALDSLKTDIGEPKLLYKELTYLKNRQQQLLTKNTVSPKQLSNNRGNINIMLKKLNMILLGQAGLANGNKHLTELYLLQEKLTNLRQKNIPFSLRQEIGEHFHCIFTAIPRDDYVELLSKYYNKTPTRPLKNNSKKRLSITPKIIDLPKVNRKLCLNNLNDKDGNAEGQLTAFTINRSEKMRNKLVFFHTRLRQIKLMDSEMKNARVELMKDIHFNIASLRNNPQITVKHFRRVKKVQGQVKKFLSKFEKKPRFLN